jgi:hypothetical protein
MQICRALSRAIFPVSFTAGSMRLGNTADAFMLTTAASAARPRARKTLSRFNLSTRVFGRRTHADYCRSLVNESEANLHLPFCCTYTSVTTKGFVTSLPPTTASRRILFSTIAVVPITRTDASRISACL